MKKQERRLSQKVENIGRTLEKKEAEETEKIKELLEMDKENQNKRSKIQEMATLECKLKQKEELIAQLNAIYQSAVLETQEVKRALQVSQKDNAEKTKTIEYLQDDLAAQVQLYSELQQLKSVLGQQALSKQEQNSMSSEQSLNSPQQCSPLHK